MWGGLELRLGRPLRPWIMSGLDLWEPWKHRVWEPSSSCRKFSRNPGVRLSRLLFGCWSSRAALPQALPPPPGLALAAGRTGQGRSALPETGRCWGRPGPSWGLREAAAAAWGVSAGLSPTCV